MQNRKLVPAQGANVVEASLELPVALSTAEVINGCTPTLCLGYITIVQCHLPSQTGLLGSALPLHFTSKSSRSTWCCHPSRPSQPSCILFSSYRQVCLPFWKTAHTSTSTHRLINWELRLYSVKGIPRKSFWKLSCSDKQRQIYCEAQNL